MTPEEMEYERYQEGILCEDCNVVIFSQSRHDCHECPCGKCSIDGGKDYIQAKASGRVVIIDLLENKLMPDNFVIPEKEKND